MRLIKIPPAGEARTQRGRNRSNIPTGLLYCQTERVRENSMLLKSELLELKFFLFTIQTEKLCCKYNLLGWSERRKRSANVREDRLFYGTKGEWAILHARKKKLN